MNMNFNQCISTIDTHVAGEAFRIVTNSPIRIHEETVEQADKVLRNGFSHEKKILLNEPRGHRGMHGCLVLPAKLADIRVLFFQHGADNSFKYEGLIATITALLEMGNLQKNENNLYTIETIYGAYTVHAVVQHGEVTSVSVESGLCEKVQGTDDFITIQVDGVRNYAIYPLPSEIPAINPQHLAVIQSWGAKKITEVAGADTAYEGIILWEQGRTPDQVRSVTFEKDGYILRSPGIDASYALLTMKDNQTILRNESLFGSYLEVSRGEGRECKVETEAFVTGTHDFVLDDDDPLQNGFLLA